MGNNCCYSTRRKLYEDMLLDDLKKGTYHSVISRPPQIEVRRPRATKESRVSNPSLDGKRLSSTSHEELLIESLTQIWTDKRGTRMRQDLQQKKLHRSRADFK